MQLLLGCQSSAPGAPGTSRSRTYVLIREMGHGVPGQPSSASAVSPRPDGGWLGSRLSPVGDWRPTSSTPGHRTSNTRADGSCSGTISEITPGREITPGVISRERSDVAGTGGMTMTNRPRIEFRLAVALALLAVALDPGLVRPRAPSRPNRRRRS